MVQVDIAQLSGECSAWREQLRSFREEFTQDENQLRLVASRTLSKEQLQDVEHLHNQFHIQLINIHDLKRAIKTHDRKMSFEQQDENSPLSPETVAEHENLHDDYQRLQHTLHELRDEFSGFLNRSR